MYNLSTTKCQALLCKLDGMIRHASTYEQWSFDEGYEITNCIKAKNKNGSKAWVIRVTEDEDFDFEFHIEIELYDTSDEKTLLMLYREPNGTWNMDPKFQPKLEKVFKAFNV